MSLVPSRTLAASCSYVEAARLVRGVYAETGAGPSIESELGELEERLDNLADLMSPETVPADGEG